MIKKNVLVYGKEYLNFDYSFKPYGVKEIRSFPLYFDFHYSDLSHNPISLNMEEFAFNFTSMVVDEERVIALHVPLVEHWNITFSYEYKVLGFIPCKGHVTIELKNVTAKVDMKVLATQHGHLYPQIHDMKLDLGQSILTEKNKWNQFWHR